MAKVVLSKVSEQAYKEYHGDKVVAFVRDGQCVRSIVNGQTGAVYKSNNPDRDPWEGSTSDQLKAAGFRYAGNTTYFEDSDGDRYDFDGAEYIAQNPEKPDLTEEQVEVIGE